MKGGEEQRGKFVAELKKCEKKAKVLSVDIVLAKNKRKRVKLEQEEKLYKKQRQALEIDVDQQ